jgi:translation elongation factor EF-G
LEQVQLLRELTSHETYKLKNSGPRLEELGYSKEFISSIVSITNGCILRDLVKGTQNVQEIYEHLTEGVRSACERGPLIRAQLCGLEVHLLEAKLHTDKVYRSPGEIIPTTRDAIFKSIEDSKKTILEPYNTYSVEANTTERDEIKARSSLLKRRALEDISEYFPDHEIEVLRGIIPMRELKTSNTQHISAELLSQSGGNTKMEMNLHGYVPCNEKNRDVIIAEFTAKSEKAKEVKNK